MFIVACSDVGHTPLGLEESVEVVCPELDTAMQTGTLEALALDEASGIVVSRTHAGVLWSHNDGDEAALYAFDESGQLLDTLALEDAAATDIEDMSRSPTATRELLWLADIGDNDEQREFVELLGVPEPVAVGDDAAISVRVRVSYPDGPHNAEAFFVDPRSGDGYIITKVEEEDAAGQVFRVAGPLVEGEVIAEEVGAIDAVRPVTAADMRDDAIIVRSPGRVAWWFVAPEQTVAQALAEIPCGVPVGFEEQGEAIAFGERGYYTTSEGRGAPIHWVGEAD